MVFLIQTKVDYRIEVTCGSSRSAKLVLDAPEARGQSPLTENRGVCSTLFDEVCKGCGRTAGEVSNWVFMSDEEKRAVWVRIEREGTAMRFQHDKR